MRRHIAELQSLRNHANGCWSVDDVIRAHVAAGLKQDHQPVQHPAHAHGSHPDPYQAHWRHRPRGTEGVSESCCRGAGGVTASLIPGVHQQQTHLAAVVDGVGQRAPAPVPGESSSGFRGTGGADITALPRRCAGTRLSQRGRSARGWPGTDPASRESTCPVSVKRLALSAMMAVAGGNSPGVGPVVDRAAPASRSLLAAPSRVQ